MRTLWRELAIFFTRHELWAIRIIIQDPTIGGMVFVFGLMMPWMFVLWGFSNLCIWIGVAWLGAESIGLYLLPTVPVMVAASVWAFDWAVFVLRAFSFRKGDGAERKRRQLEARLDRLRQLRVG